MRSYLRFLGRNKLYTAIEVVGLSLSLAFVIPLINVIADKYERSHAHEKYEDIYTVGYMGFSGAELMGELFRYGIATIALSTTGSRQAGVRVCVSQLNRPEQFTLLEERLRLFADDHKNMQS